MKILLVTKVTCPLARIKVGFSRELFLALGPPWVKINLKRFDGCKVGDEVHLEIKQGPLNQKWVSVISRAEETKGQWFFRDEGKVLPWPLKLWRHDHIVRRLSDTDSEIIDDITYDAGVFNYVLYPLLRATFGIRPKRYKKFFEG